MKLLSNLVLVIIVLDSSFKVARVVDIKNYFLWTDFNMI